MKMKTCLMWYYEITPVMWLKGGWHGAAPHFFYRSGVWEMFAEMPLPFNKRLFYALYISLYVHTQSTTPPSVQCACASQP